MHRDHSDGQNPALIALLGEAGMSNAALARAVVAEGAAEGVHLGTNPTSVKRMLDGTQPRWPVPRLVARTLSKRLHREVDVTECGFVDRSPVTEDPYDGTNCSGDLEHTVRTVVELSGRDMNRRKFLLGSAFTAAAFSEPALFALTVPPAEPPSRTQGARLGMADADILAQNIAHLRQLDHRYGSGLVREQVVGLLHRETNHVMYGSYSESTGTALLNGLAQASWLAGSSWLSFYSRAELNADLGRCHRDIGDLKPATALIDQALDEYEPWRVRSRTFVLTDLAAAQVAAGELERAVAVGKQAIDTAGQVSSARTAERLRTLRHMVRPLRASSPYMIELDDRMTEFFASNRRRAEAAGR